MPDDSPSYPTLALNEVQTAAAAGFVRVADFLQARRMGHFPESARDVPGVGPVWTRQQIETWLATRAAVQESPAAEVSRQRSKTASSPPTSGSTPNMLRVRDVSERWSLDVETIYVMIRRGELAAQRFGPRCIRVPRSAVEEREKCQEKTKAHTSGETQTRASGRSEAMIPAGVSCEARAIAIAQALRRPAT